MVDEMERGPMGESVEVVEMVEFVARIIEESAKQEEEEDEDEGTCEEADVAFIADDDGEVPKTGEDAKGGVELEGPSTGELDLSWFDKIEPVDKVRVHLPGWDDAEDPKITIDIPPQPKKLKVKKSKSRSRSNTLSGGSKSAPPRAITPPTPKLQPLLPSALQLLPPPPPPPPQRPISKVVLDKRRPQHAPPPPLPPPIVEIPAQDDLTPLSPHYTHLDPASFYDGDLCAGIKCRTTLHFLRENRRITRTQPAAVDFIPPAEPEDQPFHVYQEQLESALAEQFLEYCGGLQDYFVGKQWDWVSNEAAEERADLWRDHYHPELGPHEQAPLPAPGTYVSRHYPHGFTAHPLETIPSSFYVSRPGSDPADTPMPSPRLGYAALVIPPEWKPKIACRGSAAPLDLDKAMEKEKQLEAESKVKKDGGVFHMKSSQHKISELLACGQVLTEQDWVIHDNLEVYGPDPHMDSKSIVMRKRAEGMLRTLLLSASDNAGWEYESAAAVYIDDGSKWKEPVDDDGALIKNVAILAMGNPILEVQAAEYWGSKIAIFTQLIMQYKKENQWSADGGTLKDILINHITNELVERCQDRLDTLVAKVLPEAKMTWSFLETFAAESDAELSEDLRRDMDRFFTSLEECDLDGYGCSEAEDILDTHKEELVKVEKLQNSLCSMVNQAREGLYFSDGMQNLLNAIDSTISPSGPTTDEARRTYGITTASTTQLDVTSRLPIIVLLRKLTEFPVWVRSLIGVLDTFNTRFSLRITHIPRPCFPSIPPYTFEIQTDADGEITQAFRTLIQDLHISPNIPLNTQHFSDTAFDWLHTLTQTQPRVHACIRIAAFLLARGVDAMAGLIASTNLCCWACSQWLCLVSTRYDIEMGPVGTSQIIKADWAFPDLEKIWAVLDQEAESGFFRRPGLSKGAEEDRRRELLVVMGWVEGDMVREGREKVRELVEAWSVAGGGQVEEEKSGKEVEMVEFGGAEVEEDGVVYLIQGKDGVEVRKEGKDKQPVVTEREEKEGGLVDRVDLLIETLEGGDDDTDAPMDLVDDDDDDTETERGSSGLETEEYADSESELSDEEMTSILSSFRSGLEFGE
ncbi:hypothetical protein BJ508DRAFT_358862 [Ascobolus immersus RN42]|uniref:Uncharacterized protein n=1 Tax=Ascobolus immersus RN42 TaxID=1160509 RepID=A0A3N4IH81_ASCIM|nr:hypothetical protein BJ508DRAFT_358862 [Ascobolus immersus RN42]